MTQLGPPPAHEEDRLRRGRGTLKVGIVSRRGTRIGCVNYYVRNQYEQLTALGHDAWIITEEYGAAAESRGARATPLGVPRQGASGA